MPDQEGIVSAGVYISTSTADFIYHKLVNVNDPPSDDCCAICHQPYRTPDEYGTTPENVVRFPCGHEVGHVCFGLWFHATEPQQLRCLYCYKSVVPARYLWEQVYEIWKIVSEMSPKDIHNELSNITARGPLSRAIEPLRRYVMVEAPPMPLLMDASEDLAPNFEWLLLASSEFLAAVKVYAETSVATNTHRINFEALKRRVCELDLSYASFQSVIEDMVVKTIDQVKNVDQVKNADHGGREDDADQGGREDDADHGGRENDADQGGREDNAERLSFAAGAFSAMLKTLWAVVLLALLLVVLLVLWTVLLNRYIENRMLLLAQSSCKLLRD